MPFFKTADVGELTPAVLKQIKKFKKKRKGAEIASNLESKDFEFVEASDNFWYFRFTPEYGKYKGQTHIVEFKLMYGQSPDIYVYFKSAPKCTFMTPVWHPNVSKHGTICLDVLKDNWSPATKTASIINQIKLLLDCPETSSPQNKLAGEMMDNDPELYESTVKEFYDYDAAPEEVRELFG
jgi:ubiquitin-protein ligase